MCCNIYVCMCVFICVYVCLDVCLDMCLYVCASAAVTTPLDVIKTRLMTGDGSAGTGSFK